MTKKHFEMIARSLRAAADHTTAKGRDGIVVSAAMLANEFQIANPRFDRARFMEACGL